MCIDVCGVMYIYVYVCMYIHMKSKEVADKSDEGKQNMLP